MKKPLASQHGILNGSSTGGGPHLLAPATEVTGPPVRAPSKEAPTRHHNRAAARHTMRLTFGTTTRTGTRVARSRRSAS